MGSSVKVDPVFISITDGQFPAPEDPQAVIPEPFKVHASAGVVIRVTRELHMIRFRRPCDETYFTLRHGMGAHKFIGTVVIALMEKIFVQIKAIFAQKIHPFRLYCGYTLIRKYTTVQEEKTWINTILSKFSKN